MVKTKEMQVYALKCFKQNVFPQNRGISGTGKGRSKKFASQNSMEGYQSYSLKYDLLVYDFLS